MSDDKDSQGALKGIDGLLASLTALHSDGVLIVVVVGLKDIQLTHPQIPVVSLDQLAL